MKWLEPWWSTQEMDDSFHETFARQLTLETRPGHSLYEVPVKLIGRGHGDDALFELKDGSGRVAVVHLVWQGSQVPPWPATAIYTSLLAWEQECMIPENQEWADDNA